MTTGFTHSDEWFLHESDGFKIEFPKKPTSTSEVNEAIIGGYKMSTFTYKPAKSEKDHNLLYNVISMEITDSLFSSDKTETLPGYFKSTIDGMVRNFSGKLLSETIIEINGFPGREIKIDFQNGKYMVKVRFYMVKNKSYMIEKLTDTKKDLNKPIDRFMDSFKLI